MDGLAKVLGVVLFIVIVCSALYSISNWAINLVEVNVIKKANPSYKTKIELEKEGKLRKAGIARQEEEIRQREIELEDIERLKERQLAEFISINKIERILKEKGYEFTTDHSNDYCMLGDYIWVCGNLHIRDLEGERNYPAIAISEDGGNDYKLLKVFKEFNKFSVHSTISFLEKNIGYVEIYGAEYKGRPTGSIIYTTTDGGHNWNIILDTTNIRLFNNYVKRIRVTNQRVSLITNFQWEAPFEVIESNDGGETWTYKQDNKDIAKTSDRGASWEVIKTKQ